MEQRTLFSTITLTSTADDGSPGTLRAALAIANNGDTIDATGLSGTITLNGTALSIPSSVTINGPGASALTISGNNASQIFNINSGGVTASISGLTLSSGTGDGSGDGGAITSSGDLTLNNDVFTNNSAASAGGAIFQQGNSLSINDSTFSNNSIAAASTATGGAIAGNNVNLTITNSTFSNNTATAASVIGGSANAADGGALDLDNSNSSITNCTFNNNSVQGGGTGGFFGGAGDGGAIFVDSNGSLSLLNDTITGNTASGGNGNSFNGTGSGAGIFSGNSGVNITVENTILQGNTADQHPDISVPGGGITSNGNNIIGSTSGAAGAFTNGVTGDQVGVNPKLSALANNGGPTQTMAISVTSPARDAGDSADAPADDQRGDPRSGPADIGAFEFQDHAPTFTSTPSNIALVGETYTYHITTTDLDGDTMTLAAPTLPAWLTLTGNTLSGTPSSGDLGSNSVDLTVTDGTLTTHQTFTITVSVAAPAPTLTTISPFSGAAENAPFTITYAQLLANSDASDPSSLPISFLITAINSGTLTVDGNAVVVGTTTISSGDSAAWTPPNNTAGTLIAFSVEATNGQSNSSPAVPVQVNVTETPPTAGDDTYDTPINTLISANVQLNDADFAGNALVSQLVTAPTNGMLSLASDGSFTYTPNTGFTGADTFTYDDTDGFTTSNTATVTINVLSNTHPGALNFAASTLTVQNTDGTDSLAVQRTGGADGSVSVSYVVTGGTAVNGTDYTLPAGPLQFADQQTSANIALTISKNAGRAGDVTIILQLQNPVGGATIGAGNTITITIHHQPDQPPVAVDDSFFVQLNTPLNANVLTNDSDPDSDAITAHLATNPAHGTLSLNPDGSFIYSPAAGFLGKDSFTYFDNDGVVNGNTATVNLNVVKEIKAGAFGFSVPTITVQNSAGSATITVQRAGGSDGPVSVDFIITGGTAVNGTDYTLTPSTLQFADSQTSVTFTVTIPFVGAGEPDLTVNLALQNATGGAILGSATTMVLTIQHLTDQPPAVKNVSVTRAPGASVTINTLSAASDPDGDPLTVTLVNNPGYGTLSLQGNGVYLYTPTPGVSNQDSFEFQVSDGKGGVVDAFANITPVGAGLDLDPWQSSEKDLVVVGTAKNDRIVFLDAGKKGVHVYDDGKFLGYFKPTGRLVAYGLAGNDTIIDRNVGRTCYFLGGDGNDHLNGSDGNDILIGGNGNDVLVGGNGRNIEIGDAGKDTLHGGPFEDILIGGSTTYDTATPIQNLAIKDLYTQLGLQAPDVNARWAAMASTTGVGLRGAQLNSSTVIDDDTPDLLTGGGSDDWFIGGFTDPRGQKDQAGGKNKKDNVSNL